MAKVVILMIERPVSKKKKFWVSLFPFLWTLLLSIGFFAVNMVSYNYSCYRFALSVYGSGHVLFDSYDPVIYRLELKFDEKKEAETNTLNSLFNYYYYNPSVGECRYLFSNSFKDEGESSLTFFTQQTFLISNDLLPDGGHYIDYGMFASYYADDILGTRGYLQPRFDCDSFVFVSDDYADTLLTKYGLSSYEELIQDERYCVLPLVVDGSREIRVSINNVLYSEKRHGVRVKELYPYFGLMYDSSRAKEWSHLAFEADLKANPYVIKGVLDSVKQAGFDSSNSTVSFFEKESENGKYTSSDRLSTGFEAIGTSEKDLLLNVFSGIITVLDVLGLFYFFDKCKSGQIRIYGLLFLVAAFLVFGLCTAFLDIYPLFSIVPILSLLTSFIMCGKEVKQYGIEFFCKIFRVKTKCCQGVLRIKI